MCKLAVFKSSSDSPDHNYHNNGITHDQTN